VGELANVQPDKVPRRRWIGSIGMTEGWGFVTNGDLSVITAPTFVIPAQAGIQTNKGAKKQSRVESVLVGFEEIFFQDKRVSLSLDSRLRGNDGMGGGVCFHYLFSQ
jgi:hypothetical protein